MWTRAATIWAVACLGALSLPSAAGTKCPSIKFEVVGEGDVCTPSATVKDLVQDTQSANHTVKICGIPKGTALEHSLECQFGKCVQFNTTIQMQPLDTLEHYYGTVCDPHAQKTCGQGKSTILKCTVATSARTGVVNNVCAFTSGSVPPREPCLFHEECSSGACHAKGLCALPEPGELEECRTSEDCDSDEYCSGNSCVKRGHTGQTCSNNDLMFDQCMGDDVCMTYPEGGTVCTAKSTVADKVSLSALPWLCESGIVAKVRVGQQGQWQCAPQSLTDRYGESCDPANATQPAGTECICTPSGGVLVPLGVSSTGHVPAFSSFEDLRAAYTSAKQRCEARGAPATSPWGQLVSTPCLARQMDKQQLCAFKHFGAGTVQTADRRNAVLMPQWSKAVPAEAQTNFLAALTARSADSQMARCVEEEDKACSYTTPAGVRLCQAMPSKHKGGPGFPVGAIVGIAVGGVVLVAAAFYFLYWRPRHSSSSSSPPDEGLADSPDNGDYVAYDVPK